MTPTIVAPAAERAEQQRVALPDTGRAIAVMADCDMMMAPQSGEARHTVAAVSGHGAPRVLVGRSEMFWDTIDFRKTLVHELGHACYAWASGRRVANIEFPEVLNIYGMSGRAAHAARCAVRRPSRSTRTFSRSSGHCGSKRRACAESPTH